MSKKVDDYLDKAIKNIEDDRDVTRQLLDDVMRLLAKDEENHKYAGAVAANYVETLQRSNEQLVKVASLIQKDKAESYNLNESDKEQLYQMLQDGDGDN